MIARRRRAPQPVVDRLPEPLSGTGITAIRVEPERDRLRIEPAQSGEQMSRGFGRSPRLLSLNAHRAPGNGGPNASSASSSGRRRRVQPHRQSGRVMRRQHAGRPQARRVRRHAPCGTGPISASIASTVTPPGRSRHGWSRSGPARSIRPRRRMARCPARRRSGRPVPPARAAAVVGLTCPDRLADGAATGRPTRAAAPAPRHAQARAPPACPARRRSAAQPDNPAGAAAPASAVPARTPRPDVRAVHPR